MDTVLTQCESFLHQHAELYGEVVFVDDVPGATTGAELVDGATQNLNHLRGQLLDCQNCQLARGRTQVVFGRGNVKAQLMCVGGYPSSQDDASGVPFAGRDGDLLAKILAAIKFSLDEVYLTKAVKCMPGSGEGGLSAGLQKCSPFLHKQIAMVRPKFILAMGATAAHGVLGADATVASLREKTHRLGDVDVLVTHHPFELHDRVELKRETWSDVQKLRKLYDEKIAGKRKPGQA